MRNTMHKKRSKISICCRVSEAKFYLYHSTKVVNARPPLGMSSEYNSVQRHSWVKVFKDLGKAALLLIIPLA